MFNELKTGDKLWLKLPYGIFNFDDSMEKDSVLIAGGTGISPFMSFLQFAIDKKLNPVIHLNYGVNKPGLIIIEDLIKEAAQKLHNFKYHLFIENTGTGNTDLEFSTGILDIQKIINNSLKLNEPVYYLSGPPAMIESFEKSLINAGIKAKNIKYDIWE
ncbi:MAG: FAD-dependent oxidoreductase [Bacteroidales bacterium]|nr:FAD-dependent oxidoreductase [Bacteroidales bacterium]